MDVSQVEALLDLRSFGDRSRRLSEAIAAGGPSAAASEAGLPDCLVSSVAFLHEAYRGRTRKVTGASALLHPLRVASILGHQPATARDEVVAAGLFHDYVEDTEEAVDADFYRRLGVPHAADVAHWVDSLTRRGDESYIAHISRVTRDSVAVALKAGDVIDNLLDLRSAPECDEDEAGLESALESAIREPPPCGGHPPTPRIRGEARLYAVWKCFSLLNLARKAGMSPFAGEEVCRRAGMRECRRIAIHLFRHHIDPAQRRELLDENLRYSQSEGVHRITPPDPSHPGPDGLSVLMARRSERKGSLESLYEDKPAMLLSTLALLDIFERFGGRGFVVEGLEALESV
jgi:hypothetical protein